ncbi:vesicle-associated membrane protein 8-like, partial [Clarias magur]
MQEQGAAAPVEDPNRVKSLQSQVDGVKDIMTQNVERILARGERLDDLMDKSEDLQAGENGRSRLQQAQQDVDEVCDIMMDNLNKANEREGKLGELEDRADQLLEQ